MVSAAGAVGRVDVPLPPLLPPLLPLLLLLVPAPVGFADGGLGVTYRVP